MSCDCPVCPAGDTHVVQYELENITPAFPSLDSRSIVITEIDGNATDINPGETKWVSSWAYVTENIQQLVLNGWLSVTDSTTCADAYAEGGVKYIGPGYITPSVTPAGVYVGSGGVPIGPGPGPLPGGGLFNELVDLSAFTDGTPGPARLYQATYTADSSLPIDFTDPVKGVFTAETLKIDNLNGAVDIFISYDGATDAAIIRAGSVETINDAQGLIASVYIRTAVGTSSLADVYIHAYRNI